MKNVAAEMAANDFTDSDVDELLVIKQVLENKCGHIPAHVFSSYWQRMEAFRHYQYRMWTVDQIWSFWSQRDRLCLLSANVDEDLVGMTTRLLDLKSRLEIGSNYVRMVGIWGLGGGGKTTLASSLYMEISQHFQGHCLVENIREETSKHGLNKLQENMLSAIFKKKGKIFNVTEGKNMMKSMLCRRKVLVILDDVDKLGQLEALAGKHNWFGSGNRIIITTRDQHLLRTHKVDHVYPIRLLSNDDANQLFKRHAYNEEDPVEDFETLSLRVISYASGLPLALRVIGSFLYDKNKNEWISALDKLKDISDLTVMDFLKLSFDGLEAHQKELFLEIAFEEMGHYIVRREHPGNPRKHSRVWKREEIKEMCFGDTTMENDKTEGLKYYVSDSDDTDLSSRFCKIVSSIKKLRWVNTYNVKSDGGPTFLSNELQYVNWRGYLASSFPDSFHPIKLLLKLTNSKQKELWKGCKHLPQLKVLHLEGLKLQSTPDFHGLPRLQNLTLEGCYDLEEIHPSFGSHTSLEYLNVSDCPKLRMFPTIAHMRNLKSLKIIKCNLKDGEIPSGIGELSNLKELDLNLSLVGTNIVNDGERLLQSMLEINSLKISVKQASGGVNSEDDVVSEECDGDENTFVWYVSFGSLINTAWRDQTYKALFLDLEGDECSGFGIRLIAKKR
ncbi:hypothetical protein E3N88_14186 [Mikania micrantha]|uniref:NB-ARC domain-containing protein n=1 Tax=Mikania micrantha TaxID=192012 RepID=A0A5N6P3D0_9ASTR|nr:hypothetical protein E3N88_14186 [Mikania micrantha]